MLDAAIEVLATHGWSAFNLNSVAHAMGLSERPVRNRASSKYDLAAQVWRGRLGPEFEIALEQLVGAYWLLQRTGDGEPLQRALTAMLHPTAERRATAELLTLACFNAELRQAIDETLGARLRQWVLPSAVQGDVDATRTAVVCMLALGFALTRPAGTGGHTAFQPALAKHVDALRAEHAVVASTPVPSPVTPHIDEVVTPLHTATVGLIGERGFDGVTVREIAGAIDRTEGFIFGQYGSKLELLQAALRAHDEVNGYRRRRRVVRDIATTAGPGRAFAAYLQQRMHPADANDRHLELESLRLSHHHIAQRHELQRQLDAARTHYVIEHDANVLADAHDFTCAVAMAFGASALAALVPAAASLPYATVTVPLLEGAVAGG